MRLNTFACIVLYSWEICSDIFAPPIWPRVIRVELLTSYREFFLKYFVWERFEIGKPRFCIVFMFIGHVSWAKLGSVSDDTYRLIAKCL